MKYMAIDYGLRRTGVAVSDDGGRMAFPRCTVQNQTRERFFADLLGWVAAEQVQALVVGLPLLPDGQETLMTRQARNFVERLKRRVDLPVFWMNEALSSHEAEHDLREAGANTAKVRRLVDQQAAVRILETFLAQAEQERTPA